MGKELITAGIQTAQDLVNTGMGLLLQGQQDRRQLKQQGKLQALEISGQKQMTDYNYNKQLEMWNATNYAPQMEQLRKAGLNPGLIYGMSGGGAVTTGNQGGNVTGAHAPVGGAEIQTMLGMGIQKELLQAQKENIQADTKKKEVEAAKTAGVDTTKAETEIQNIKQQTENAKIQYELGEIQVGIQSVQEHIAKMTQNQAIARIATELRSATALMHTAENDQKISTATMQKNIEKVSAELAGIYATNELQKTLKGKAEADIENIANNIKVTLGQLANETDRVKIQQQLTNFETSFGGQAAQVLQTLLGLLPSRGKQSTITHQGGQQNTTIHKRE